MPEQHSLHSQAALSSWFIRLELLQKPQLCDRNIKGSRLFEVEEPCISVPDPLRLIQENEQEFVT